jgi:hypothetical protein
MTGASLYRLYRNDLVRESGRVGFDLGQASKEGAVEKVRYQPEANVRLYPKRQKGRIKRPLFLRAPDKSSRDKHCG